MVDSKGGTVASTYNARDELISRSASGAGQTTVRLEYTYTDRGQLDTISRYSDLAGTVSKGTSDYDYDDKGRLTDIVHEDSTQTGLSQYTYGYDAADRVTTHTWESTTTTGTLSGTYTYTYDATNQLTHDSQSAYSYDLNGNRTMAGYQTDDGNRMSHDGVWTYTYDDEGNRISRTKGAGLETWYYDYDHRNLLTAIHKTSDGSTSTLRVTYTYDAEGKRVKEEKWDGSSTQTTKFAYDGQHVWADLDNALSVLVRYLYRDGIDQIESRWVASGDNSGRAFYLTDRLGSVRDLVDWSEDVRDHVEYDGFGNATHSTASFADRYGFTGREFNTSTGLQYNRARYYDAATGRWLSEDPIGFAAGDANLYRYVGNTPPNGTDPDGRQRKWWKDNVTDPLEKALESTISVVTGIPTSSSMVRSLPRNVRVRKLATSERVLVAIVLDSLKLGGRSLKNSEFETILSKTRFIEPKKLILAKDLNDAIGRLNFRRRVNKLGTNASPTIVEKALTQAHAITLAPSISPDGKHIFIVSLSPWDGISKGKIAKPRNVATLAHEFLHVLQIIRDNKFLDNYLSSYTANKIFLNMKDDPAYRNIPAEISAYSLEEAVRETLNKKQFRDAFGKVLSRSNANTTLAKIRKDPDAAAISRNISILFFRIETARILKYHNLLKSKGIK